MVIPLLKKDIHYTVEEKHKNAMLTDRGVEACEKAGQKAEIRMQPGYDHSYYFISTFMAEHVAWHAERLKA